jgi:3-methyladenine DNA glycosylase/8-oxoguanine DNA glycosylase
MADDAARQEAVEVLARQLVTDVSPAELPLFDATAARYHADPDATLEPKPGGDDSLGFGVETAVVLVAPYAIDLVKRIFTRVAQKVGDSAADSLAAKITHLFGGTHKHDGPKEPDPLTPEQLALVAETAREEAKHLKLPADRAEALANGVVAALATRT